MKECRISLVRAAMGIALSVLLAACGGGGSGSGDSPTSGSVEATVPAGWTEQKHEDGRVEYRSPEGDSVVVWPLRIEGEIDVPFAQKILPEIVEKLYPGSSWEASQTSQGGKLVRMVGRARDRMAALAWTSDSGVTAATVYVTQSPNAQQYAVKIADSAKLLEDLRVIGGTSGSVEYVSWNDPKEGAFSVTVPQGWSASGGVRRRSLAVQASVKATSPDGFVFAQFGDDFPWYVEPNPLYGWYDGRILKDTFGSEWHVRKYRPGNAYTKFLLNQEGLKVTVLQERDRTDLAGALQTLTSYRSDAGELVYSYSKEGRTYRGGILCITQYLGGGAWIVWRLYRFETPEALSFVGSGVLNQMVASFQINPEWQQRNNAEVAKQSRIITEMTQSVYQTVTQGYWSRDARFWEAMRKADNARLGIEDVYDLQLGETRSVSSGSNYYWIDGQGNIVGTQTNSTPGIDFRQMIRLDL